MVLRSIDDQMTGSDSKSIMRSLGEFVGHHGAIAAGHSAPIPRKRGGEFFIRDASGGMKGTFSKLGRFSFEQGHSIRL